LPKVYNFVTKLYKTDYYNSHGLYYNWVMGDKRKSLQLEILLWIAVILLLLLGFSVSYRNGQKQYETHKIFLADVDGLIVGSPVKLMGVQVGYVKKIKIVGDSVYIRFVIKDKDLHLPWGTTATVEFSGLAGSRSLELYPPDGVEEGEQVDYIHVVNPTRLSQSLHLLYEMYNKFTDICYGLSSFGTKLESIDMNFGEKNSNLQFANFLDFANSWLDNSNNKISELRKKYRKGK